MAIVLSLLALYWLLMGEGAKIANTAAFVTFYDHNLLDLTFDTKLPIRPKLSKQEFMEDVRCLKVGWFLKSMKMLIWNWPWMAQ